MGRKRIAYVILVEKSEGKRLLRKQRCRWFYNIKIDLREIGWDGMDWIYLTADCNHWRTLLNTVRNHRVQ